MKLVTINEMRLIEKEGNDQGVSYEEMMQHAGLGLAQVIEERFMEFKSSPLAGMVGTGNNGGDSLVAMTDLLRKGWSAVAFLIKDRTDDVKLKEFADAGGRICIASDHGFTSQLNAVFSESQLILDGILGTGTTLPLREDVKKFLTLVKDNLKGQVVLAVDCPSGIDCQSGDAANETLKADLTVSMEAVKTGMVRFPAFNYCGELLTIPIGLPKNLAIKENGNMVIDKNWVAKNLPKRVMDSHKGTYGNVLVVGGSVNYVGAPMLSGQAAYRTGSGLVTLAVTQSIQQMSAGNFPEATWLILNDEGGVISELAADVLLANLSRVNCLIIGPGIGREDTTSRFLDKVLLPTLANEKARRVGFLIEAENSVSDSKKIPAIVLDADGLHWLSSKENWPDNIKTRFVLTPHPGEMAELTGLTVDEIQRDRQEISLYYAKKWNQIVVLKGALTVVASPEGRLGIIPIANSALAKAGSGDVLSGMIASLIGQGMPLFEAACVAAWIHGKAGIEAADVFGNEASVMASDIIRSIPRVLAGLKVK